MSTKVTFAVQKRPFFVPVSLFQNGFEGCKGRYTPLFGVFHKNRAEADNFPKLKF